MKDTLREIFRQTLDEIHLDRVLPRHVQRRGDVLAIDGDTIDLAPFAEIIVIAFGKAAGPMARFIARELEGVPARGVIVSPTLSDPSLAGYEEVVGGHPYPDAGSVRGAEAVLRLLESRTPNDLVIFLVSGGGSALLEKPIEGVSLADSRRLHELLVTCGAGIVEVNALRKHCSAVKGGKLAARAAPARQLTLHVSDVPRGHPSAIASGPTMPDETTVEECRRIVERHQLAERLPASIWRLLRDDRLPETPKPGDPLFACSDFYGVLDNAEALAACARHVEGRGWIPVIEDTVDGWPLDRAAEHLLARLDVLHRTHDAKPVALVSGGELHSPVADDHGQGGRNQAFVLECVERIAGESIAVLSAGTDGIDGNSPAAGAVADGDTLTRAGERGLVVEDFRRRSDSHRFFRELADAIDLGATGNNVRDIRILVRW